MATLFPDSSVKKAEEDVTHYEEKGSSSHKKGQYHPYERSVKFSHDSSRSGQLAWKTIGSSGHGKKCKDKSNNYSS